MDLTRCLFQSYTYTSRPVLVLFISFSHYFWFDRRCRSRFLSPSLSCPRRPVSSLTRTSSSLLRRRFWVRVREGPRFWSPGNRRGPVLPHSYRLTVGVDSGFGRRSSSWSSYPVPGRPRGRVEVSTGPTTVHPACTRPNRLGTSVVSKVSFYVHSYHSDSYTLRTVGRCRSVSGTPFVDESGP